MRRLLLVITFFLHMALFAQWQPVYPLQGGFTDVFFTSRTVGYVTGTSQDLRPIIYKTVNSGRNWMPLNLPANWYASSLTKVFFTAPDTGYVLAAEGSVLKTTNAGASWTITSFNATGSDTYTGMTFTSRKTGYVCSKNGAVFKTADAGTTWAKLPTPPVNEYHYASTIAFLNDTTGFLIHDFYIYKTTNGGASWNGPVQMGDRITNVHFVNSRVAYAFSSFSSYRTVDGGATWRPLNIVSASQAQFFNAASGLLFEDYSYIYKTDDSCNTGRKVYHSEHPFSWSGVHFYDSTFGCAVGGSAIVTTEDGGATWTTQNLVPFHDEFRDIYFPNDTDALVIGDFYGIIRTNDGGNSWYLEEESVKRSDKYMLSFTPTKDTGLMEVVNNYTYITYDGGKSFVQNATWTPPFIGHLSAKAYFLFDSKNIFTVGVSGGSSVLAIAHTTNGGATWQKYVPPFSNALFDITFVDKKTGYACGVAGKIVKTSDGGATWQEQETYINNDLSNLFFTNAENGFAYGAQGTILKTTNGGRTWTNVPSGTAFPIVSVRLLNDSLGFAFSSNGGILKTTDGGSTWKLMNNTNQGQLWLNKVVFKNDSAVFAIGAKTIYTLNVNRLQTGNVITAIPDVVRAAENAILVYPNPATGMLRIKLGKSTFVKKIEVYDVSGKQVRQTLYGGVPITMCTETVSGLTNGYYWLRITDRHGNQFTKPFIKN